MNAPARIQRSPLVQTTSRDAFRDFDPTTVDGRILTFIRDRNGATVAEIVEHLGIPHQTASAQVSHLKTSRTVRGVRHPARIHASDEKRPTPSGRPAIVWLLGPSPDAFRSGAVPPFRPNPGPREQLSFGEGR